MNTAILENVAAYYAGKVRAHGATPAGVDWKSAEQQTVRFDQLLKLCASSDSYSLLDYGCGYGALLTHLQNAGLPAQFFGYDACAEMIDAARRMHSAHAARFTCEWDETPRADYVVASGVFNVKGDVLDSEWGDHVCRAIDEMAERAKLGFAFNVLTTHVDFQRPDLYYADPAEYLDYCAKRYSRKVALFQDYGLYEFTLLVRK